MTPPGESTTTALEVLDRTTGELLSLQACDDHRLGEFLLNAKRLRAELADAERAVQDEILNRMDRQCAWTVHADGIELKAPSPTADSTDYPHDMLRAALDELVQAGVIDTYAAENALHRQLRLTVDLPWRADMHQAVEVFVGENVEIKVAGHTARIVGVEPRERASKAGVNALLKNPAAREAVKRARVHRDPPARTVSVKG